MRIGIPTEIAPGEHRVAGTPRTVRTLVDDGFDVTVQSGAGARAGFTDEAYVDAGAEIVADPARVWGEAEVVLTVQPPQHDPDLDHHEADLASEGACVIGFIRPADDEELLERLAARRITVLAMDRVPRITRAQKVDALSAMANAAGYRAVVEAASHHPRFFSGQTTAAGSFPPATVLVIGAGVAGLAAIGAARGLGARVRAFDTRPEVADQVRSMGAEFLELKVALDEDGTGEGGYAKPMSDEYIAAEMALFREQAREVDIVITTALVPGRRAPELVTADMVESMRPGSVIVDMAAQQGGNCTLTEPGEVIRHGEVTIVGYTDLASRMALQTSELYASTLVNLIDELGGARDFRIDRDNEIVRGVLVAHEGEVLWPPPAPPPRAEAEEAERPGSASPDASPDAPRDAAAGASDSAESAEGRTRDAPERPRRKPKGGSHRPASGGGGSLTWLGLAGLLLLAVGGWAPESFLSHLTVFVLACFVGWQVVWNVTPSLHTPLMSVTNAISGIIILGGILHLSGSFASPATILGFVAVLIAAINVAGGFLVTRRMLAMFRR